MRTAKIGRHPRQLATSWNELSGRQLLQVAALHRRPVAPAADELLRVLLQVPARTFRRLTLVQRVELRPLARFLSPAVEAAPLTAQLLPVLRAGLRRYHGPREAFRNLTFDEFIFADTFYLRYCQQPSDRLLTQLVATLYRPQRAGYDPASVTYQGDRRQDFNEHLLPARAARLAGLPPPTKHAVLLYYRGCRRLLEQRYDHVFTASTTTQATASGWQDVLHELAGGVHRLDATAHQGLHNVLREMNRVLRQAAERADALRTP